ncbi:MAG: twin transmembrane helix small protein [Proteobacteria bacterium]|nr:MAG: twin transmembrane helix small protein [Pseudomonadota bacterium]
MLVKLLIVLMLIAMLVSLFSALFFMFTDRGGSKRTVKALTVRVGIWVVLLALLAIGSATGILKPIRSVVPPVAQQES